MDAAAIVRYVRYVRCVTNGYPSIIVAMVTRHIYNYNYNTPAHTSTCRFSIQSSAVLIQIHCGSVAMATRLAPMTDI